MFVFCEISSHTRTCTNLLLRVETISCQEDFLWEEMSGSTSRNVKFFMAPAPARGSFCSIRYELNTNFRMRNKFEVLPVTSEKNRCVNSLPLL